MKTLPLRFLGAILLLGFRSVSHSSDYAILGPAAFARHVARFHAMEDETVVNAVGNDGAWDWLGRNISLFECPDREVEEIYYFRWWSFRKHLVRGSAGFVITQFLQPVSHAPFQMLVYQRDNSELGLPREAASFRRRVVGLGTVEVALGEGLAAGHTGDLANATVVWLTKE